MIFKVFKTLTLLFISASGSSSSSYFKPPTQYIPFLAIDGLSSTRFSAPDPSFHPSDHSRLAVGARKKNQLPDNYYYDTYLEPPSNEVSNDHASQSYQPAAPQALFDKNCTHYSNYVKQRGSVVSSEQGSSNHDVERCMSCICEARDDCSLESYKSRQCSNGFCGPFQISHSYWMEAGRPGLDFEQCSLNEKCSEQVATKTVQKWAKYCKQSNKANCDDYAILTALGPYSCDIDNLILSNYWNKYKHCMMTFNYEKSKYTIKLLSFFIKKSFHNHLFPFQKF